MEIEIAKNEIDRIWQFNNWNEIVKYPKRIKVNAYISSIQFKMHQAQYHLSEVLENFKKVCENDFGRELLLDAFVAKCEFDSLIYALNSAKDITARFIAIIYDINIGGEEDSFYFSDFFDKKKSYGQQLKNKNPKLFSHLRSFNRSDERKWVSNYCNTLKHRSALQTCKVVEYDDIKMKHRIILKIKNEKDNSFNTLSDKALSSTDVHRKAICKIGELILEKYNIIPKLEADFYFLYY